MPPATFILAYGAAALLLVGATPAAAGIVATYQMGSPGLTMTVEVGDDGTARIENHSEGDRIAGESYVLVTTDGRNLRVWREDGQWVAADLRAVEAAYAARGQPRGEGGNWFNSSFSEDGPERVGEWLGTRYVFTYGRRDSDYPADFVLLRSDALAPLGRAMWASTVNSLASPAVLNEHGRRFGALLSSGAPLRVGTQLRLISLEVRPVDPARLAVPARWIVSEEIFDGVEVPVRPPVARN